MREMLTGDDLFAEVLLLRDQDKIVVLVEGPDDVDALESHVSEESSFLIPGYGKSSVEHVVALADDQGLDFVLAVLDRDWIGVVDEPHSSPNIVYTDLYDLDATIVFSRDICRRVVANFCDSEKMKRHLSRSGVSSPIDLVLIPAVAVGVLRLLTRERNLPIKVRDFPIGEIMNMDGGEPSVVKMVVIGHSKCGDRNREMDQGAVAQLVAAKMVEIGPDVRYCSGHDLAAALAAVMRKKWGCTVGGDAIIKTIRAAFACENLVATLLYSRVEAWAVSRNVRVWTCPRVPKQLARAT